MQGRISTQDFLNACANGDLTIVESFLETAHPLDVCASFRDPDQDYMTAIMLAAKNNQLKTVERIIAFAKQFAESNPQNDLLFDFNIIDDLGRNALMHAAEAGHTSICQLLVENGCDPRNTDIKGKAPDQFAKDNGHGETMLLLLNAVKKSNDSSSSMAAMKIYSFYKEMKPAKKPAKQVNLIAPITAEPQESIRITRSMTRERKPPQKK